MKRIRFLSTTTLRRAAGSGAAVLALASPAALAQAPARPAEGGGLAQYLPADTIALLSLPDLTATLEDCRSLPLWKIYGEKSVHDFLEKPFSGLRQAIEKAREQAKAGAGLDPGVLLEVRFKAIEAALTRLRLPEDEGGEPEAGAAFAVDAGADFPKLKPLLDALKSMVPPGEGAVEERSAAGRTYSVIRGPEEKVSAMLFWDNAGTSVFLGVGSPGSGVAEDLFSRVTGGSTKPSLSSDSDFRACAGRVGAGRAGIRGFIRMAPLLDLLTQALSLAPEGKIPSFLTPKGVSAALRALGLDGLRALAFSTTAQGEHSVNESFVLAPEPRKGLLGLGGEASVDLGFLKRVPKEASSFSVGRLDAGAVWDTLFAALGAFSADLEEKVRGGLSEFESAQGVDIRKDLLGSIGDQYVSYSMPMKNMMAGMGGPDVAVLVSLRDPAAFERASKALGDALVAAVGMIEVKEAEYEGTKIRSFAPKRGAGEQAFGGMGMSPLLAFLSPAYAVKGDVLLFSLNRQSLQRAIRRLGQDLGEGAAAGEGFKRFSPRVPSGVSSLSYSDSRPGIGAIYSGITAFLPMVAAGHELPIDLNSLPPAEAITKHLFGSVSYSKADRDGFYECSFSPLGADTLFGLVAVGGAVGGMVRTQREGATPEVVEAPSEPSADPVERAKRDMVDLKSGLTLYRIDHDRFPANLSLLLATSSEYPEGLLRERKEIPKDPWGNAYVYQPSADGKGYKLRSMGPDGRDESGAGDDIVIR